MKKLCILICTILCAISAITLAETPAQPTKPNPPAKQEVHLYRQQSEAKHLRTPSFNNQVGGTYDGMMLTLEVDAEGIYTLCITSATDEQELTCSGAELISGIAVEATTSFDIVLTTESGTQYTGHVDISE